MDTKYELIMSYIKSEIQNGNFKTKLPSIRALAIKFSCSNSTVIRAYSELEKNNLIYAMPKSGYFVSKNSLIFSDIDDEKTINFASGEPSCSIFPAKDFQKCINKAIDKYGNELFSYGAADGFLPLKSVLNKKFKTEGIDVSENKICFTNGVQEALSILSSMKFPNGKQSILIEDPTYNLFLGWIKNNNFSVYSISRNFSGISLDELKENFKNNDIKFFYTMPRLHNPLGTSYTEEEKKKIIELANKYDVYIAEDDYLYNLWNKEDMSLKAYDTEDRVVHMKSFSKTLLPSMRLGAIILPDSLKDAFFSYKIHLNFRCPQLFQGALTEFIESGQYDIYVAQIKKYYAQKLKLLKQVFDKNPINGLSYNIPLNGFFSYVNLPSTISFSELYNALSLQNIEIRNMKYFTLNEDTITNSARLSVSNINDENVIEGAEVFLRQVNELLRMRRNKANSMIEL